MSVLGIDQVLKKVKKNNLVANLGERELTTPEGVGVDLRLGAVHKITGGGAFIEVDHSPDKGLGKRKGVKTKLVAEYQKGAKNQKQIVIKPKEYYLVQTIETLNTPKDLMPMVYPRTSLFRAGILLLNSKTDPGYQGALTLGLINLSPFPVKLQLGARVCNLVFHKIEGKSKSYRGQHQGGRISPVKIERQV